MREEPVEERYRLTDLAPFGAAALRVWGVVGENGETFHADSREGAVAGYVAKMRCADHRARGSIIDWELCRRLGFCEIGIRRFCEDFFLDCTAQYLPAQLLEAVQHNPHAAAPYAAELRKLAATVSFTLPDF